MSDTDAAMLSRMLFTAREQLTMWADVVTARTGRQDPSLAALIAEIDAYRAQRGWSPHGYGGEDGTGPRTLTE